MPFEEEGAEWYFVSTVYTSVFSEQNRLFIMMAIAVFAAIAVVVNIAIAVVWHSQSKINRANADAKARSAFLANMSHEIRTPLNGIIGLIYLMEKDLDEHPDESVLRQRLSKTRETAEYLLSLINNILDITKLQAGKVEIKNEPVSPESITDAIWSMQKSSIDSRGIDFVVNKDITVPWIIGDDLMIKQVLMNILSNAMKFTPVGGTVTFSVTQKPEDDGRVATTFTCSDTGCGMSREFMEHIWDSFSQERDSNSESIKGTGLGMAISKVLVDAMGGEISVESKLGEGSTFRVVLHSQIAEEEPDFVAELESRVQITPPNEKMKILIAEDNELNSEILSDILESEGFDIVCAEDGKAAVERFAESAVGEIDVILMDMQMPVMDGCAATREIRAMGRADAKTVKIFACTANNFNEDRELAEESGMNDFLSKPIDVTMLLKKLGARVMGRQEADE
jgi:signal transduction histidine kinase/CheY-like chemotaxis protein